MHRESRETLYGETPKVQTSSLSPNFKETLGDADKGLVARMGNQFPTTTQKETRWWAGSCPGWKDREGR